MGEFGPNGLIWGILPAAQIRAFTVTLFLFIFIGSLGAEPLGFCSVAVYYMISGRISEGAVVMYSGINAFWKDWARRERN